MVEELKVLSELHSDTQILNSNLTQLGRRLGIKSIPQMSLFLSTPMTMQGARDGKREALAQIQSISVVQEVATSNQLIDWIQNPRRTRKRVILYECLVVLHWVTKMLMKRVLTNDNMVMAILKQNIATLED